MAWLGTWAKRVKVTISNANVDSDLSDFPVLISISTSAGIGNQDLSAIFDELTLDANRKKIALTTSNGTTQCYVEIERWDDANEKAWLWIGTPTVSSAANTILYLYYDSSKADNTTYIGDTTDVAAQSVWDSNFVGVWHLSQDPTGGSGAIKDSTDLTNHGTGMHMAADDLVDSKIGKGLDFDGTDDYVDCGSSASLSSYPNGITLEAVFKVNNINRVHGIITKGRTIGTVSQRDFDLTIFNTTNKIYCLFTDGSSYFLYLDSVNSTTVIIADTWYYVAMSWDGTTDADAAKLYLNNVLEQEETSSSNISNLADSYGVNLAGYRPLASSELDGIGDEFRISKTNRTAPWLKTNYYNNSDNLVSDFTFETPVGWTGKVSGITNPAKINGIAVANIASVMGQ